MRQEKNFGRRITESVRRHERWLTGCAATHAQQHRIELELESREQELIDGEIALRFWQEKMCKGRLTN
jgi:hypothetical protein